MALEALKIDSDIVEDKDTLGGGSFVLESGIYEAKVDLAYLDKSKGGAMALNIHFLTKDNQQLRQTLWVTSGDAKGNKNTYLDKEGNKHLLPGMNQANHLAMLTTGKEIAALDTEEKVVKLYNFDAKEEIPTKVNVITEMLNREIILGVMKQVVDKNVKNDDGVYVPSGDTREENEITKIFSAKDKRTVTEIKAEATEAQFIKDWDEKWTGVTRNKAKGSKSGAAGGNSKPIAAPKALFT